MDVKLEKFTVDCAEIEVEAELVVVDETEVVEVEIDVIEEDETKIVLVVKIEKVLVSDEEKTERFVIVLVEEVVVDLDSVLRKGVES